MKESNWGKQNGPRNLELEKIFNQFNQKLDKEAHKPINIDFKDILKFIYRINPFYLISACLFLYAQTVLFNTGNIWIDNSVPMALLAAYTILMAATGILVVKAGKVWDDARSILLVILLLFIALSVGMDSIVMDHLLLAPLMMAGWFMFAFLTSETLRRSLKIKIPTSPLIVYYALLALFFFYPCLPGYLLDRNEADKTPVIQAIMGFQVLASILFLCLVPAVRKGAAYFKDNGTPWKWPWFPGVLFGVLGFAVCCRTYFLSISFIAGKGVGPFSNLENGFDLYMLIPFAFAIAILATEYLISTGNRKLQTFALAIPAVFYMLLTPFGMTNSLIHREFVQVVTGSTGSTFLLAIIASAVFYIYVWIRKIPNADFGLLLTLLIVSLGNYETGILTAAGISNLIPISIIGIIMIIKGFLKLNSAWLMSGLICLLWVSCKFFDHTWYAMHHGAIPIHLGYLGALVLAFCFRDKFAEWLRVACAPVIPLVFFTVIFFHSRIAPGASGLILAPYLILLGLLPFAGYFAFRHKNWLYGAALNIGFATLYGVIHLYRFIYQLEIKGLGFLFWCAVAFIMALCISLIKGGLIPQWPGFGKILESARNSSSTEKGLD